LTDSTGDREKIACQRFAVNRQVSAHFIREMDTGIFVVLPLCERELVRDFGGEDGTKSPRIFSKSSLSTDLVRLYQLPFELG